MKVKELFTKFYGPLIWIKKPKSVSDGLHITSVVSRWFILLYLQQNLYLKDLSSLHQYIWYYEPYYFRIIYKSKNLSYYENNTRYKYLSVTLCENIKGQVG